MKQIRIEKWETFFLIFIIYPILTKLCDITDSLAIGICLKNLNHIQLFNIMLLVKATSFVPFLLLWLYLPSFLHSCESLGWRCQPVKIVACFASQSNDRWSLMWRKNSLRGARTSNLQSPPSESPIGDWKVFTNFQNDLIKGTEDMTEYKIIRQKSTNFVKLRDLLKLQKLRRASSNTIWHLSKTHCWFQKGTNMKYGYVNRKGSHSLLLEKIDSKQLLW